MRKLTHDEIERPNYDRLAGLTRHPVVAVLDDIRSLYNVGSIFRTADAALIEKLYLCGITGTPAHPGMHKTALGAQDVVPWEKRSDASAVLEDLRNRGYCLAALEITSRPTHIRELSSDHFPICLVVGNEVSGVKDHLLEQCDIAIEIPQYGLKQSLNV